MAAICAVNTGCTSTTQPTTGVDLSPSTDTIFEAQWITAVTSGVADWQLAHMEDFDGHIRTFQSRSRNPREWIQGAFLKGLADWSQQTNNIRYLNWLKHWGESQNYRLGDRLYHADDHVVGQYYLALYDYFGDPAMIEPTREAFDAILRRPSTVPLDYQTRGHDKGYSRQCLKRWCWADALFMSPPVWTEMSSILGVPDYFEFSNQEFWLTVDALFDRDEGLFLRDSRFLTQRESNGERVFWSRGNGWVFAGLTDIIETMPSGHRDRQRYIALYQTMARALVPLQDHRGFWPVSLKAGELYEVPETSGTAFFVAGLAWGIANDILSADRYLPAVKKGWRALNQSVAPDGMIGWVQQVGYSPDKVAVAGGEDEAARISANETQFYGAGAFLLAGSALIELNRQGIFER